jgi:hypothetical protein
VTGNVGGGIWYVSSHSKYNIDAIKTFLEFIITNEKTAGTGGLPAYASAADTWLTKQASSGFYAGDFKAAVSTAAGTVWNGWSYPKFSPETAWSKIIVPGLAAGEEKALAVREPGCPLALDRALVERARLARTRGQEHEVALAAERRQGPLAVGRKPQRRADAEADRRRSVGSPQVHRVVAVAVHLILLVEQKRLAVLREVVGMRPVEPRQVPFRLRARERPRSPEATSSS